MTDLSDAADHGSTKKSGLDDEVSEQDTVRLTVDLPRDMHQQLKVQAAREDRSMRDIALELFDDYLAGA